MIDQSELEFNFVRASGPGGQHVNKAATAVQLRFDVAHSNSLPEVVKRRLMKIARNRTTSDGALIINASQYRSQHRNREDALDRLRALVRRAASRPAKRKKTRTPRWSRERRLEKKRRRSEKKRLRKPPREW